MCNYMGYEFGAGYLDSVCIDGYLWDADAYDDGMYTSGGEWACPRCNTAEMLADAHERALEGSCGESMRHPWCAGTQWDASCAKAIKENPEEATKILEALGSFEIEDWPDREAVYQGRAPWDFTVSKRWSFVADPADRSRTTEGGGGT